MKSLLPGLLLLISASSLLPRGVWAEGSKQLTPNTAATAALPLTDPANTRSGFLAHDANNLAGANTSLGFLKPNGFNFNGVTFSEDHRMYVRVKAGETLLYGVHRISSGQAGTANQRDLILTLRYGAGAGIQVQQTTLTRDQASANQSLLTANQNGVINTAAEAQAGPLPAAGGYRPLTYTNTTGADREFYLEFTQVGEGTPGAYDANFTAAQRFSTYDFWDFTVRTSAGVEQPGRLHAKLWSFSAGATAGRYASTFALLPLVPDPVATTRYFVKKVELAGFNPQNFFRFVVNSRGTTASATDFTVSRKSQLVSSGFLGFPEFDSFVQNPDPTVWPSAVTPTFSVRSVAPFCGAGGGGQLALTTTSSAAGRLIVIVDLNGTPGYQANTRDAVVEQAVPAGTSTVVWNGLDGLGAAVPSGTSLQLAFQSGSAPMNFPLFDAENNADGFRVEDIRPGTGFNLLFWDDANLPVAQFPEPRVNLGGALSSAGVHPWGNTAAAAAGQPPFNAGDQTVINTFTYGSLNVVNQAYTFTYNCDGDADGVTNANDVDWDNDGISNTVESGGANPLTLTASGAPTYLDAAYVHPTLGAFRDVNSDGVNDVFDLDLDGRPNFFDIDADGDGITDVVEANASGAAVAGYDPATGRITGAVGANGMPDAAETAAESAATRFPLTNTDGANRPDFLDVDADNDGIPDNTEGQPTASYRAPSGLDTDGDGLDNTYDPTPGGAVAVGTALPLTNTDATDQPDYRDTDADNDGRLDSVEGWDTDNNGVANTVAGGADADQDGLDDAYDILNTATANSAANAQNGRLPTFYPDVNKPGGDRDWRQVLNLAPVANNATNSALLNSAGATVLAPNLSGSDADGTVTAFVIRSLPPGGVLAFNGTAVTVGQSIPAGQLAGLTFDPASGFAGTAAFTYTATDNNGLTSDPAAPATYTIPVQATADVTTMLTGPATLNASQPSGNYTVTFVNNGPNAAANVTRTATLPAGATAVVLPAGATYDAATRVINFGTVASLANGETDSFVFSFTAPATPGNVSLLSTVGTATTQSPNTAPDQATLNATVNTVADVATSIAVPTATVAVGATGTFNVSFLNEGPNPAADVTRQVQLPAGLANVAATNGGTYNSGTGLVTYPSTATLASGGNLNSVITFTVPTTTVTATATIGTSTNEAGLTANNTATLTLNSTPVADVTTTLTGPGVESPGQPSGSYVASFRNNGPNAAANVTRTVTLPAGATAVVLPAGATYDAATRVINFGTVASLANGETDSFVFSFTAPATPGNVSLLSTVGTATTQSPNTAPDQATLAVRVNAAPVASDVTHTPAIASTAGPTPLTPLSATDADGTVTSYTVLSVPALTQGTLLLGGVAVTAGQVLTPAQATQLSFDPADQNAGNITFTYAATDNNDLTGNTATYTIPVTATADVTTALTGPSVLTAGRPSGNYTASFTNNGPNPAANVTQTVLLPTGATNVVVPPGATYDASTRVLDFGLATTLNSGATNSFVFSYTAPTTSGPVTLTTNVGTATSQGANAAPDMASLNATVRPAPVAVSDVASTTPGTAVTLAVTANDLNDIDPATIDLDPSAAVRQTTFTVAGQGTYTTIGAPVGSVIFTPAAGFTGSVTIPYTVRNTSGIISNVANLTVTVRQPQVDVATSITAPVNNATATAGQPLTFTVVAANPGTVAAPDVVQTLQLPAGLTVLGFTSGSSYNSTTGLVTFPTITSLAAGGTQTFGVTFTVPGSGPIAGTASVRSSGFETTTANNTATVTVNVTAAFDLTTTINGPASTAAGQLTTFAVTTRNNGPSAATDVVQTAQLPTGLSGVYVSDNGRYDPATGMVSWPAVVLTSGQNRNYTVSFLAPASGFTAAATVNNPGAADTAPANNTATAPATAVGPAPTTTANVYTGITNSASNPAPGTPITYTVTTGNHGAATATDVVTTVSLPAGLILSGLPAGASYAPATGLLTLNATPATVSSGAATTYTFQVVAPPAGTVVATAFVTSTNADPMPSDNVASTPATVLPTADVVTILNGPAAVTAGQPATYTVTTRNNGGATATDVAQTVQLPIGLTGVIVSSGGAYDAVTGLVTFPALATQLAGTAVTNTITFNSPANGVFTAVAAVGSSLTDGVATNNSAVAAVTVTPVADVSVLVVGPADAPAGSPVTYVVTARNNGLSTSQNVGSTLQLVPGLLDVNVPNGTYDSATGLVTFDATASLLNGQSVTNTVTLALPDGTALSPVATVTSPTSDTNADNNRATLSTVALAPTTQNSDLAVAVTTSVSTATPGQSLTLTAVFVNGEDGATVTNLVPQLVLPAGLAGLIISNGGTYDPVTGVVTWPTVGSLASGSTLAYTVRLMAPVNGPLIATGVVRSDNSDTNAANNVAAASVAITPRADVTTRVTGPARTVPGAAVTYSVTSQNNGPTAALNVGQTLTLPADVNPATVVITGGGTLAGNTVTWPTVAALPSGAANALTYSVSFAAPTTAFDVTANVTSSSSQGGNTAPDASTVNTTLTNRAPVALAVVNTLQAPQGDTGGQLGLLPLAATDADGSATLASYRLATLPLSSQGVLYYLDGASYSPAGANQVLTPAQAASLTFDPAAGFAGNTFFTFTTTDTDGLGSAPALYTIPVGQDANSLYTNTPAKGGSDPYLNGDVLSNVFDVNGGSYNAAAPQAVTDGGVRTAATDAAGTTLLADLGVGLDPVTGQLTVADRTKLRAGTYTVNLTTVDEFGGTNTQSVTFPIGDAPLPVALTRFEVRAVQLDGVLNWTTAQELNNDYFDVERSFDGRVFGKIGQVQGRGTAAGAQTYSFIDRAVGVQRTGVVYYRLKQVDDDGTSTYSPVRILNFSASVSGVAISVYPNPATIASGATLDLTRLPAGIYSVSLIDLAGRQLGRYQLAGGLTHPLGVDNLPDGVYVVRVTGKTVNLTTRLVKK